MVHSVNAAQRSNNKRCEIFLLDLQPVVVSNLIPNNMSKIVRKKRKKTEDWGARLWRFYYETTNFVLKNIYK